MKFLLLLLVVPLAFAAPLYEFDPDCIDEDEPILEPEAYGMGVMEPHLVWDLGNDEADVECEDEPVTPPKVIQTDAATEECEDPIEPTQPPKILVTQPPTQSDECVDPITEAETPRPIVRTNPPVIATDECEDPMEPTTLPPVKFVDPVTDECEDEDAAGVDNPFLNFHIEKAEAEEAIVFYEENAVEDIEECDDY